MTKITKYSFEECKKELIAWFSSAFKQDGEIAWLSVKSKKVDLDRITFYVQGSDLMAISFHEGDEYKLDNWRLTHYFLGKEQAYHK